MLNKNTKEKKKMTIKDESTLESRMGQIAWALEELSEEKKGPCGSTIADSLESLAMDFTRYVDLLEKQYEANKK